uniref:Uncharacterized protein n=1 Tax=viral metagenome TaxID=1070528 RepID=A0A6M3IV73_9ZZZZ
MERKNITLDDQTIEYLEWLHEITGLNHSLLIRKGIRLLRTYIMKELKKIVEE